MRGSVNKSAIVEPEPLRQTAPMRPLRAGPSSAKVVFTPSVILRLCMLAPPALFYGFFIWSLSGLCDTAGQLFALMMDASMILLPFVALTAPHIASLFKCPEKTLRITMVSYFSPIGFSIFLGLFSLGQEKSGSTNLITGIVYSVAIIGGLVWAFWPSSEQKSKP